MLAKVFLIDDQPVDQDVVRALLKTLPVDLRIFSRGRDALARIEAEAPTAVIVDMFMPDMDGIEVIRTLRRNGYAGLIVAVSSGGSLQKLDVLKYARVFGADVALRKPVTQDALAVVLRGEIEGDRLAQ